MDKLQYLSRLSFEIKKGWIDTENMSLEVSIPLSFGFTLNELEEFCKENNVFIFEFGKQILIRGYRKHKVKFVPQINSTLSINGNVIPSATEINLAVEEVNEWIYFDYQSYSKNASF
ncbi:hypothetical protein AAGV28_07130 [Flavobacterium sp. FZUC8N2.13]|uniref:Immunity protein 50 n=1 Tax=Flavobacterium zubiriense TaxID=3138075 RepID=A0ABV4TCV7_9FLAO